MSAIHRVRATIANDGLPFAVAALVTGGCVAWLAFGFGAWSLMGLHAALVLLKPVAPLPRYSVRWPEKATVLSIRCLQQLAGGLRKLTAQGARLAGAFDRTVIRCVGPESVKSSGYISADLDDDVRYAGLMFAVVVGGFYLSGDVSDPVSTGFAVGASVTAAAVLIGLIAVCRGCWSPVVRNVVLASLVAGVAQLTFTATST